MLVWSRRTTAGSPVYSLLSSVLFPLICCFHFLLNLFFVRGSGMPVMADSEETVKGLLAQWDYTWAPLIELKRIKDEKHRSDYHWITGVTSTELLCVICRGGDTFPKVLPKPVVSTVPLQIPVVALADTAAHEERYLRGKMALDELQFSEGLSELDPADMKVLHAQRRKLDNSILACISRAVQSQRPGRALDLSTFLSLPASLDTAVKLAVKGRVSWGEGRDRGEGRDTRSIAHTSFRACVRVLHRL